MYCDNSDGEYCIEINRVVCCSFSSLYSKFSISILQIDVTQERVFVQKVTMLTWLFASIGKTLLKLTSFSQQSFYNSYTLATEKFLKKLLKVALDALHRIFLNLSEKMLLLSQFNIKNWGHWAKFWVIKHLKLKLRVLYCLLLW